MNEPADHRGAKLEREERLGWQSRLLLTAVLGISAVGLLASVWRWRTPATAEGLVICAGFGLLVWGLRAATLFAAFTGFVLTSSMYVETVGQPAGGWFHTALAPGLALFVLAFAATRFRRSQKEQSGLAESREGRRASQVAANMGAAAIAALALPTSAWAGVFSRGFTLTAPVLFSPLAAALAQAAADTVSSEIGQAIGGEPVLITSFQRVLPGTDGAVSWFGTAAGCFAALLVVIVAIPSLQLTPRQALVAWAAAICGLFADSLLGATLERRGWLNNDMVNFVSTALAATIAYLLAAAIDQ
jgi:uncharacterized protein (TIGR00297 family)